MCSKVDESVVGLTAPDIRRKNLICQWPGIFEYDYASRRVVSIDEEKTINERLLWLIQTVCPNHITLCTGKQEVGALVSVFEKSATELKPKPKLLTCKNTHGDFKC